MQYNDIEGDRLTLNVTGIMVDVMYSKFQMWKRFYSAD